MFVFELYGMDDVTSRNQMSDIKKPIFFEILAPFCDWVKKMKNTDKIILVKSTFAHCFYLRSYYY